MSGGARRGQTRGHKTQSAERGGKQKQR